MRLKQTLSGLCADPRLRVLLWPLLLWVGHGAAFLILHGSTEIIPGYWQLLPAEPLREAPLRALWHLHAQPPVLNALYAALLLLEALPLLTAEGLATALFLLLSGVSIFLWFAVFREVLKSTAGAGVLTALLVLNPAFADYAALFFYTHIVMAELAAFAWCLLRWLQTHSRGWLAACAAALTLIFFTRASFHPILAPGLAVLIGVHLWRGKSEWHKVVRPVVIFLALALLPSLAWMGKNKVLFGTFNFSSWTSLNLSGGAPVPLRTFIQEGGDRFLDEAGQWYGMESFEKLSSYPELAMEQKNLEAGSPPDFRVNMNHLVVPPLNARGMGMALSRWKERPLDFLHRVKTHVILFDLPSFSNPSSVDPVDRTYHIVGWDERVWDSVYHGSWLRRIPLTSGYRPSLFILLLPGLLAYGLWQLRYRQDPERFLVGVLAAIYAFHTALVLLVDGVESARMRWPLEPVLLVTAGLAVADVGRRVRERFAR